MVFELIAIFGTTLSSSATFTEGQRDHRHRVGILGLLPNVEPRCHVFLLSSSHACSVDIYTNKLYALVRTTVRKFKPGQRLIWIFHC